MKYKTLTEVITAFQTGELKRTECEMVLDNDKIMMYPATGSDDVDCEPILEAHPNQLVREMLTLLGIPWVNA